MGGWYNGIIFVSKTNDEGSTPSPPAKSCGVFIMLFSENRQNRLRSCLASAEAQFLNLCQ